MTLLVLPIRYITSDTCSWSSDGRKPKFAAGMTQLRGGILSRSEPMALSDLWFDQERLRQQEYAVVEFWSLRCEACRIMAPVVSQIAEHFDSRLPVFKVNADDNPRMVSKYRVPLVPYLILFCYGEPIARFAEQWSIEDIESELAPQEILLNAAA